MRDTAWLQGRLDSMLAGPFADVVPSTPLVIQFGRASYRRLGSIALRPHPGGSSECSLIRISAILRDEAVPAFVIDQIIAHELVHYVQGFGSRHKRTLRHPHQGGVILAEFQKRGLVQLWSAYRAWIALYWLQTVRAHHASLLPKR